MYKYLLVALALTACGDKEQDTGSDTAEEVDSGESEDTGA